MGVQKAAKLHSKTSNKRSQKIDSPLRSPLTIDEAQTIEKLQSELVSQLYSPEIVDDLIDLNINNKFNMHNKENYDFDISRSFLK